MSKFFNSIFDYLKRCDKLLWLISICISAYCLILLKSVSRTGADYFTTQLIAIILGYIGAVVLTVIDYRIIAKFWYITAVLCLGLIIYTLIAGITVEGNAGVSAKAWINLPGGITFQPSELVKIGFMITFAKHLSVVKEKERMKSFLQVAFLAAHAMIPVILSYEQGDTGAGIIFFFMFLAMAFIAGVQLRYFFILFSVFIAALPIAWQFVLSDYQKNRIINLFNGPQSDPLGDGFQQVQGQISIGSGELWGRGLFQGPRVEHLSVPVQESDFIFSVAGEELGFMGCVLIIFLIFALLLRSIYIAKKSCDPLGMYMCFGFFGMIAAQTIFNLGMCLSILPVMGVTLPFFSAGGSSAACLYLGLGLLQNVYMHRDDTDTVELELSRIHYTR